MRYIGNVQSQAESEVYAVASGALPDGKPVVVNSDGTVSVVGGGNLTSENFIGFSDAAYADTQTATIQAGGAINTGQSSLTIGQQYFVQTDGTIGTTAATPSVIAGTAVSATDLIVKG